MVTALWFAGGLIAGLIAAIPLVRRAAGSAERRARDAERRALEAERLAELGSMTGGLAHEIKNPLSTIGLNAQLLQEGLEDADLPADVRQRLSRRLTALAGEVERLGGILTDFLEFAGRMKLDAQRHDLRDIVEELVDFFHPQCDRARVVLRAQLPDRAVPVDVDQRLLKQAILNLMINGIQAMSPAKPDAASNDPAGDLMISVRADSENAFVHVTDTGPGIPPERIEEILRPYVSHRAGGTGLGLPTARRIVEEHGGSLSIRPEPGQGSDFIVRLPLSR